MKRLKVVKTEDAKITLDGPKYSAEIDIGFTRLKVENEAAKADESGADKGTDDSDDAGNDCGGVL